MPRFFCSCSLLALMGVLSSHAHAQQLSQRGQSLYRNAEISLRNVTKDPSLFDGTKLMPNARLDRCRNHVRSNKSNLGRAIGYFNKLPPEDRALPQVKGMEKKIREMTRYLDAMEAAVNNAQGSLKTADDACRQFEREIMSPVENRTTMGQLARALQDPGYVKYNRAERVTKAMEIVKAVQEVCAKPQYKDVGKVGCRWMKVGSRERDPSAWCEAASRGKELVQQAVKNFVQFSLKNAVRSIMTPEELVQGKGWLRYEAPITFNTHLHYSDVLKANYVRQFQPLLEAADLKDLDDANLWAAPTAAMDRLREAVLKAAPGWKLEPPKSCNYGCNLAKRQLPKWYKGVLGTPVRLKKTIMTTDTWHITKNRLGVPQYRSMHGYVIFQLPKEPFCQVRSYRLEEQYEGGGRYQRVTGVKFGHVRYQRCR